MNKIVNKRWLEYRAKTIETQNLKRYGKSKAWISILQDFNACIVCVHDDCLEINYEKYKEIRASELSVSK